MLHFLWRSRSSRNCAQARRIFMRNFRFVISFRSSLASQKSLNCINSFPVRISDIRTCCSPCDDPHQLLHRRGPSRLRRLRRVRRALRLRLLAVGKLAAKRAPFVVALHTLSLGDAHARSKWDRPNHCNAFAMVLEGWEGGRPNRPLPLRVGIGTGRQNQRPARLLHAGPRNPS